MTPGAWKLTGIGLTLVLLIVSGAAGGAWLAGCHYRPLLDIAHTDLAVASQARDNLESLAGEQGSKIGELVLAGEMRARDAALAIVQAKEYALLDYATANELLRERTGGDPTESSASIIDKELGL